MSSEYSHLLNTTPAFLLPISSNNETQVLLRCASEGIKVWERNNCNWILGFFGGIFASFVLVLCLLFCFCFCSHFCRQYCKNKNDKCIQSSSMVNIKPYSMIVSSPVMGYQLFDDSIPANNQYHAHRLPRRQCPSEESWQRLLPPVPSNYSRDLTYIGRSRSLQSSADRTAATVAEWDTRSRITLPEIRFSGMGRPEQWTPFDGNVPGFCTRENATPTWAYFSAYSDDYANRQTMLLSGDANEIKYCDFHSEETITLDFAGEPTPLDVSDANNNGYRDADELIVEGHQYCNGNVTF